MFKGFKIVVKKGEAEELVETTDKPFEWFPELETMFTGNFYAKELKFDLDLNEIKGLDENIVRITFLIRKF